MGDADPARARRLVNEVGLEKLSPEAIGWILPVLSDDPASVAETEAIRRHLNNRVTETAGAAHFVTDYGDDAYLLLYSDRRADGIILEALIGDQPESDLIPKLVRGLLSGRKAGHWANTQENVFILLALDRYFNTYEAETPDFVARIWLGDTYAGDAEFRGRTTDYRQIDVPMSIVAGKTGSAGPDPDQGRAGPALLPDGDAVRAHRSAAPAAGPRLHGRAQLRGGGQPGRRAPGRDRRLAREGRRPRARAS